MHGILIQWSWDLVSIENTHSPSFFIGWDRLRSDTRGVRWLEAPTFISPTKTGEVTWWSHNSRDHRKYWFKITPMNVLPRNMIILRRGIAI